MYVNTCCGNKIIIIIKINKKKKCIQVELDHRDPLQGVRKAKACCRNG